MRNGHHCHSEFLWVCQSDESISKKVLSVPSPVMFFVHGMKRVKRVKESTTVRTQLKLLWGVMSMKSIYKLSLETCGIGRADKIPRSGAVFGFDRRQASQEPKRDFDMSKNS